MLALGFVLCAGGAGCKGRKTKYPEQVAKNALVTVDISLVGSSDGRFYTYRADSGKNVEFFIYRESSGVPRAVLDACRQCYRWKKGYLLEGKQVVCVKCDMRFDLDGLAQGTGSCVPIRVRSEERQGALVIPVSELEAASRFF